MFFYLQINVYNIYGLYGLSVCLSSVRDEMYCG